MLLKVYNKQLIEDRERTTLTTAAAAGDTALTVGDTDLAPAATSSNTWADNDYVLVGNFGEDTAEIVQMAAAVTSATSLTIDRQGQTGGMRFAHAVGTPVYRLDYNRVEFNNSATDSTSGVAVLTTIAIQPDDDYTRYEDTANSTGYGFVRFNNQTSGAFSSYSDGVNYTATGNSSSRDPRTLWRLRKRVRRHLNEPGDERLKDADIDEALNDKQRDIAHEGMWSFYEKEKSFSLVANQFAYTIPATVHKAHNVKCDTQPLIFLTRNQWDMGHFDTNQSTTDVSHYSIWDGEFKLYPRPSTADSTTTLGAAITTTTATSITVVATSAFNRGDYYRFIIDSEVIYATASTSTTFTGCRRGMEGTTAATHLNGATVTERSLVYTSHEEPTDLIDTQDRTQIPEPDVLALGAAIDLLPVVGKSDLLAVLTSKYELGYKKLKDKFYIKQTSQFSRVKDSTETVGQGNIQLLNPNLYPSSITGS